MDQSQDTLKVRLQTQPLNPPIYNGLVDCVRKTIAWEGPAGLYKGVSSPLAGAALLNAIQFFSYGQAISLFTDPDNPKARLNPIDYFKAGLLTGIAVSLVESPVDLIKSQLQVQIFKEKSSLAKSEAPGVVNCTRRILHSGGIRGIYQGLGATFARDIPAVGLYFGAYEYTRELFSKRYNCSVEDLSSWQVLAAGGSGGFCYWLATYPLDVIKTSMQTDSIVKSERTFRNIVHCASSLYRSGGFSAFFRGISPCLMRSIPANAACFYAYEKSKQILS